MIEVFEGIDEPDYPEIFDDMFRMRHELYVKRRKWNLVSENGRERDQFDVDDTTYLLALDEDRSVLGGIRLMPTMGPHLFRDIFPHLAGEHGVPRSPDILELTRFFVRPRLRAFNRTQLTGALVCGMFEHCLEAGISKISSVIDTFFLAQMLELGWTVKPLSLPMDYGQGSALGVLIDVSETALASSRLGRHVEGSVLKHNRTPTPFPNTPQNIPVHVQ
ncbi:MAG: GNAT family N-acetyltransferase [Rhodospirillales bacterium]|nr:GNAT family N-acetyltransferase [Rhodospirillales bacterium]